MRGEHVGLLHGVRVDALTRLDVTERREAIAKARGTLVVLGLACVVHQCVQPVLDLVALAAQEAKRLVDQRAVFLDRDFAGAWRAAALDLI